MITQPRDREVICHASAWDVDNVEDLRIKMCTRVNADDFVTVHHELGHNYYQRAYNQQPFLYLDSANDGFHEAIGDMIALSVTPEYLVQIGLLPRKPGADRRTRIVGLLLRQAMDKVAFLPFGLLVDRYRWGVFSGEIAPADYNRGWNDLRLQYQGIVPPVARTEQQFRRRRQISRAGERALHALLPRPHPPVPVLQGGLRQAGWQGPLHRCSFYGNKRGRPAAERDAGDGRVAALAGRARGLHRHPRDVGRRRWSNISGRCWAGSQQQNRGRRCGW